MKTMNRLEELRKQEQRQYLLSKNQQQQQQQHEVIVKSAPPKPEKTHPDGEWGWVVVGAAFLTQFIIVGLQNSSGVIFNELVKKFDESRGNTGFVSSISCGMMFLLGPVATALCQRFGCRKIAVFGGFLCCIGMGFSAHASSLQMMYVTFGLTWGLGTSFCYFPTLIILVPYFNEKLALVNGIVSAGAGVGTLILSPTIQWFATEYGVKNMFYGLAGLHSLVLFSAFLYRPLSDKYKLRQGIEVKVKAEGPDKIPQRQYTKETLLSRDSRAQLDRRRRSYEIDNADLEEIEEEEVQSHFQETMTVLSELFRDRAFLAWCLGLSVFMLGYFVPFVHLVRYAKLIGIADVKAAFLISVLSIVATVFKVLSGRLAGHQRLNTMKLYQLGLLIMGVATTLIPVSHSYVGLVIYAIAFGISESCFIVMIPLITKDIVGVQRLPLALGCVFMLMGIPTVIGAPIAGWIYDAFQDYSYAFYVAGLMNIVGVLIMFLITLFQEEGHLRKKVEEERMRFQEDRKKQEAASETIVLTSFTSTERIYVSQRDLNNPFEEHNKRPHVSKIIEFTSFASSERIYLSSRDMIDPYSPPNNNTKAAHNKMLPPPNFPTPQINNVRFNRPGSISFGDSFKIDFENRKPNHRPLSLQFEPRNSLVLLAPLAESEKEDYEDDYINDVVFETNSRPESPVIATKVNKKSLRVTSTNKNRNGNVVMKWWTSVFKKTFPQTSPDRVVTVLDEKLFVDSRLTVV